MAAGGIRGAHNTWPRPIDWKNLPSSLIRSASSVILLASDRNHERGNGEGGEDKALYVMTKH